MDLNSIARDIFLDTLTRVKPEQMLPEMVRFSLQSGKITIQSSTFHLEENQPLYIIGTGKAAASMAAAAENIFGNRISGGFVIVPPGAELELKKIRVATGSHPIPDEASFAASKKLVQFVASIPENALVLNVLSGGTSALFSLAEPSIPQHQISDFFKCLIECGASIDEINSVRPAVSSVKAGKFLARLNHTTLIDLIISDIPDDNLKFVGSGPTTAQEISFQKAVHILRKYDLWQNISPEIKHHLEKNLEDNPIVHTQDFDSHYQFLLSSAALVAGYAREAANARDFSTVVISPAWTGPITRFVEKITAEISSHIEKQPSRGGLVFFGEPTVKVTGSGLGGRNQELTLHMAKVLPKFNKNISFLSCGTDGIDGPTDVAGAVADQDTLQRAKTLRLDVDAYLKQNDSYHFFRKAGGHIATGPTGNNVMDLQIVLWE